jgi:DNA polymerase-1
MAAQRLFLLDAYALIFRAYFAFAKNPRVTSSGLDTSAIYGFALALMDVLEKEKPSHLAVVFDIGGSEAREAAYPAYKAHRDETPEGIKIAVPYIHEMLEALRIPHLGVPGYEADDVIGTLAHQAESAGFEVFMMTPDKDFGQLVTERVKMYRPGRGGAPAEVWGMAEVCERWGIERIDQVVDMLGLMGDAVDNIPGIPGVGEKTATKLLAEFGTLENVLENASSIKGKLGEKIAENAEMGRLSKQLARILTDVPIQLDPKQLEMEQADETAFRNLCASLEFRTVTERLLRAAHRAAGHEAPTPAPTAPAQASENPSAPASSKKFSAQGPSLFDDPDAEEAPVESPFAHAGNTSKLYQTIDDAVGCKLLVEKLLLQKSISLDTETTSLDVRHTELVGMSFSYQAHTGFYVPFSADREETRARLELFQPLFQNPNIEIVGQNLKFDLHVLLNYGIKLHGPLFDTLLAHYLLQPDQRHNLDALSEAYLGYKPISIESLIGPKGPRQKSMRDIPVDVLTTYAAEDADVAWQLAELFRPKLIETGVDAVFRQIETPLVPVLAGMENQGIAVDRGALKSYSDFLGSELAQLEREVLELAGVSFNLASPRQLGEILFERLQIGKGKIKKTKTGQYATGEEILEDLRSTHPIVNKLLEWRQVGKLKSTYVDALPQLIDPITNRIHTTFNQTVAATGRLSSTNPNLQNIPIRTERGRKIRGMFVAGGADRTLVSADYSQIELRIIAALSGDPAMIEAFQAGVDIHTATASKVFNVPLESVTKEQRSNAKTVNFGIIYGVSAFGLSQQTALSRTEAKDLIEQYFQTYPGIKSYMDHQVAQARSKGYVETLLGRRRYLKDIDSRNQVMRGHAERNAVNAPIQGTAADIVKLAMVNLNQRLTQEGLRSPMVLQVHDELVFDAFNDELDVLIPMIKHEMEHAYSLAVPLVVEVGKGANWLDAH